MSALELMFADDSTENYGHEGQDGAFASDVLIVGGPNTMPVVSDRPESGSGFFDSLNDLLGSVGTTAQNVSKTARDLGTAVGTIKRAGENAGTEYRTAYVNASSGNKLGQWWAYSTTQDKVMAGLALAAVVVGVVALVRD